MNYLSKFFLLPGLITGFLFTSGWVVAQPQLLSVSVDTTLSTNLGRVKIEWKADPTFSVDSFQVFHRDADGQYRRFEYLPATFTSTIHKEAHANQQPEAYKLSYISHGVDGILSEPHQTIFLTIGNYNKCDTSFHLEWTSYVGWPVKQYTIFGRSNHGTYRLLGTTTDTTFVFKAEAEINYIFYVQASNAQDSVIHSMSNFASGFSEVPVQPNPDLSNISTVNFDGSAVELTANFDAGADVTEITLQFAANAGGPFSDFSSLEATETGTVSFNDQDHSAQQPLVYRILFKNSCGRTVDSTDKVQPVILQGDVNSNKVSLHWNSCYLNSIEKCNLYLSKDGSAFTVLASNLDVKSYQYDSNQSGEESVEQFCFRISVEETKGATAQSNEFCMLREPEVEMPKAFTPNGDGLNDNIVPEIRNADIIEYQFIIYDRYGERVFESMNKDQAWDGKYRGKAVGEGGYLYYLKFKTRHNREYEKSGSISVVFP